MSLLQVVVLVLVFFFKQKTAYEITRCLEFRRVLFRSPASRTWCRAGGTHIVPDVSDLGGRCVHHGRSSRRRRPPVICAGTLRRTVASPLPPGLETELLVEVRSGQPPAVFQIQQLRGYGRLLVLDLCQ